MALFLHCHPILLQASCYVTSYEMPNILHEVTGFRDSDYKNHEL